MIHLGTDLVRVSRFESTTDHFLRRSFTEQEIRLSGGKAQSLAGRWAVKESVLKALGMGMALPFSDIEVRSDDLGRPVLVLTGVAAERASELGIEQWSVSISHDGEYAIAVVVGSG
ncbi:MAG: holo-ACP synthase [Actinobacteria bacterium]|nr:holo-ACP synthase [Actinomycetota bacterium]